MRKTAIMMITVLMGALLCTLAVVGCGNSKDEPRFATIKGGDGS